MRNTQTIDLQPSASGRSTDSRCVELRATETLTNPQPFGQLAIHELASSMLGCCQKGAAQASAPRTGWKALQPLGVVGQESRAGRPAPLALPLALPQVSLLIPATYLVFWAFLLVFSFISEPVVCGVGIAIILTGVPIFFLGAFWRRKPKCVHRLTGEPAASPRWRGLEMGPSWGLAREQGLPAAAVATQSPATTECLPTM